MSTISTSRAADEKPPGQPPDTRNAALQWLRDTGWRLALAVAATVASGLSAPAWLSTVLTLVATSVVVERVVRFRRRGMLDAALVGAGLLAVSLGLLGLILNYLPGGISRTSWSIGAVLLAVAALTAAGLMPEVPPSPFRPLWARRSLPTAVWGLVAAGIVAFALVISTGSYSRTHIAPLDLSSTAVHNGTATLTVSSGTGQGPFEVDLVTSTSRAVLARNVVVAAGVSSALVIAVPPDTRALVQLVQPGTTLVLRELIFDTTKSSAVAATNGAGR